MDVTARKLVVEIIGDARGYERAMGKAVGRTDALGGSLRSLGKVAAFVGSTAAVGGMVATLKGSIDVASNLHEQINKVNVVFRQGGKEVNEWSKTTATSLGIAQDQALEFAGTFGNLLVPMGIAREKAATLSTHLVKLAADMASFNNADPKEVLESLQSGLSGQIEPLRRFGIFLTQDRIKAFALTHGIVKATKDMTKVGLAQRTVELAQIKLNAARKKGSAEKIAAAENTFARANIALGKALKGTVPPLTAQQKALATYGIILKDTKDAQGDFGRTSGGLANQQRIFQAQLRTLLATMGTKLLPVVLKVVTGLNDLMEVFSSSGSASEKFQNLLVKFGVSAETSRRIVADLKEAFNDFRIVVVTVFNTIRPILEAFWKQLQAIVAFVDDLIHGRWAEAFKDLGAIVTSTFGLIKAILMTMVKTLGGIALSIGSAILNGIVHGLEGLGSKLLALIAVPINAIIDSINLAVGWLVGNIPKIKIAANGAKVAAAAAATPRPDTASTPGPGHTKGFAAGLSGRVSLPNVSLAGLGPGIAAAGGMVIHELHLHGVQNVRQLESELARRAQSRPHRRRGT